jgi:hypothetical protein
MSNDTLNELEKLRKQLNAGSLDEVLRILIKRHRLEALRAALGADTGRMNSFTQEDRGGLP